MRGIPEKVRVRNALIEKIFAQYDLSDDPEILPVVSLEDFFEGNWEEFSLAPNMVGCGRPHLMECYRLLRDIRSRDSVQDVLVAIHESPYPDDPKDFDIWPDSDTVYVLTSASQSELEDWSVLLKPDDIGDKWSCNTGKKPLAAPELESGMSVFALWWD